VQLLLEKIRYNFLDTKIDKIFLTKGLICLGLAIVLFGTQTITKLSPGVVAMLVAMITHSHDMVDLKHVDFLVTEEGIKDKTAISEYIKAAHT